MKKNKQTNKKKPLADHLNGKEGSALGDTPQKIESRLGTKKKNCVGLSVGLYTTSG